MKKFLVGALVLLTIAVTGMYLLSCLTPFVSPADFWPVTFLALGFPLIAVSMFLVIGTWFFVKRKVGLYLLLVLIPGYKNLNSSVGLNINSDFKVAKDSNTLRVLDWNVWHFVETARRLESPDSPRRLMINFIKEMNADVLLLQEFEDVQDKTHYSNIKVLQDTLGFAYYYLSQDYSEPPASKSGKPRSAIFSKYPLSNIQRVSLREGRVEERMVMGDITFQGKKIKLATMHLISLNLGEPPNNASTFGRVDPDFLLHTTRMQKLKYYDSIHGRQADLVRAVLNKSPYPLIVSGDFNSVAASYAYHTVKGNLNDAFLQKGFGLGRTYSGLSPTLRIDFIFTSKEFKVKQFQSPKLYLSDHFPLVTDLSWK